MIRICFETLSNRVSFHSTHSAVNLIIQHQSASWNSTAFNSERCSFSRVTWWDLATGQHMNINWKKEFRHFLIWNSFSFTSRRRVEKLATVAWHGDPIFIGECNSLKGEWESNCEKVKLFRIMFGERTRKSYDQCRYETIFRRWWS